MLIADIYITNIKNNLKDFEEVNDAFSQQKLAHKHVVSRSLSSGIATGGSTGDRASFNQNSQQPLPLNNTLNSSFSSTTSIIRLPQMRLIREENEVIKFD